jgi:catechol 2,3-dioxygenase-like lactoylglutathione lyase family enzyme
MTEGEQVVIHHVQLACPAGSETVSRAFYSGVLGLAEIDKPPALAPRGGCWFRGHGFELHLGVEAGFQPARKAHPALLVSGSTTGPHGSQRPATRPALTTASPGCAASIPAIRTGTGWSSWSRLKRLIDYGYD